MTPQEHDQAVETLALYLNVGFGLKPLHDLTGVARADLSAISKRDRVTLSPKLVKLVNELDPPDLNATRQQSAALRETLLQAGYSDALVDEWLAPPVSREQLLFVYHQTGIDVGPGGRVMSIPIPPSVRDSAIEFATKLSALA